jgi:hypothetical protein
VRCGCGQGPSSGDGSWPAWPWLSWSAWPVAWSWPRWPAPVAPTRPCPGSWPPAAPPTRRSTSPGPATGQASPPVPTWSPSSVPLQPCRRCAAHSGCARLSCRGPTRPVDPDRAASSAGSGWIGPGTRRSAARWWWLGRCPVSTAPMRRRSTRSSPGGMACGPVRPSGSGSTRGRSSVRLAKACPSHPRVRPLTCGLPASCGSPAISSRWPSGEMRWTPTSPASCSSRPTSGGATAPTSPTTASSSRWTSAGTRPTWRRSPRRCSGGYPAGHSSVRESSLRAGTSPPLSVGPLRWRRAPSWPLPPSLPWRRSCW